MTSNSMGRGLTPFVFEGRTLRAFNRNGDPWFIAGDAAGFLAYRDAEKLTRGLDEDEKDTHNVGTLGGRQNVAIVSEAGLYRAIMQRREVGALPVATREFIVRFQRWVLHDVLPTIRRTGRYEGAPSKAKQIDPDMAQIMRARETRLTFAGHMRVLKALGIANAHAVLAANQATKTQTGFDTLAALGVKHLPPDTDSAQINSTTLGQHLGGLSAQEANKRLVEYGYSTAHRDAKGRLFYELTDKGRATGGRIVPTGKKHSDGAPVTQCVWSMTTVEALRRDMHGEAQ